MAARRQSFSERAGAIVTEALVRFLVQLIPADVEPDSRGGFPRHSRRDSLWKTGEGFPWRRRSSFEATSPVMLCGG
jgi:hypothetical protein